MTKVLINRELLEQAASMELDTTDRSIRIQDEIRAILAQPAVQSEQQPVGEMISNDGDIYWADRHPPMGTKLYIAPSPLVVERDKLAKALRNVEREHDLIRRMKNCEILRGRGSFGIAVMSDPLALEWQALDKELQRFVDARRAALAASTGQEVCGE